MPVDIIHVNVYECDYNSLLKRTTYYNDFNDTLTCRQVNCISYSPNHQIFH